MKEEGKDRKALLGALSGSIVLSLGWGWGGEETPEKRVWYPGIKVQTYRPITQEADAEGKPEPSEKILSSKRRRGGKEGRAGILCS